MVHNLIFHQNYIKEVLVFMAIIIIIYIMYVWIIKIMIY